MPSAMTMFKRLNSAMQRSNGGQQNGFVGNSPPNVLVPGQQDWAAVPHRPLFFAGLSRKLPLLNK